MQYSTFKLDYLNYILVLDSFTYYGVKMSSKTI